MGNILVVGGYGVFGAKVAAELAARGHGVTLAGRSKERAEAAARRLGPQHRHAVVDTADAASCERGIDGHSVAVNASVTAGGSGRSLLQACLAGGVHHVDLSEDRDHVRAVREAGSAFAARGLVAAFGCSSLPGISGALAEVAAARLGSGAESVDVVLFIGGDNARGPAAILAALGTAGRTIAAPQGALVGFGRASTVDVPGFGRRRVRPFDGADYDLLPDALHLRHVRVMVGFQLPLVGPALGLLGRVKRWSPSLASRVAVLAARVAPRIGSSGGAVVVDVVAPGGSAVRAAAWGPRDGQRLAALPAALVANHLASGAPPRRLGAVTAAELLTADRLLADVAAAGFFVEVG